MTANLNDYLNQQLDLAEAKGQMRHLMEDLCAAPLGDQPLLRRADGQPLVNFSSNDYLGLSRRAEVISAAQQALTDYGTCSRASRLMAGHSPTLPTLEARIAEYRGSASALVFGSGYTANVGSIAALMNPGDLIIADKLSHACLLDGAKLSGAQMQRFAHNDAEHLRKILALKRSDFAHCLIISESIFSMDGDRAPTSDLLALAKEYDCWLMIDDAHGAGFCKEALTQVLAYENGIVSGTLSKAVGSLGGYVAGSAALKDFLVNHARSFMFSTALPPASIAAADQALALLMAEPELAQTAMARAQQFTTAMGLAPAQSPIVPYIVGEGSHAIKLAERLAYRGMYCHAVRPPTVPPGTARLRLTFTAMHSERHVQDLTEALTELKLAP